MVKERRRIQCNSCMQFCYTSGSDNDRCPFCSYLINTSIECGNCKNFVNGQIGIDKCEYCYWTLYPPKDDNIEEKVKSKITKLNNESSRNKKDRVRCNECKQYCYVTDDINERCPFCSYLIHTSIKCGRCKNYVNGQIGIDKCPFCDWVLQPEKQDSEKENKSLRDEEYKQILKAWETKQTATKIPSAITLTQQPEKNSETKRTNKEKKLVKCTRCPEYYYPLEHEDEGCPFCYFKPSLKSSDLNSEQVSSQVNNSKAIIYYEPSFIYVSFLCVCSVGLPFTVLRNLFFGERPEFGFIILIILGWFYAVGVLLLSTPSFDERVPTNSIKAKLINIAIWALLFTFLLFGLFIIGKILGGLSGSGGGCVTTRFYDTC